MIKLLNVTYRYPDSVGVEQVSFEINSGEFILLVGKPGAGKTSLFRLLSLELYPDSGEIRLEQFNSNNIKRRHLSTWRKRLGVVYQDTRLLTDRSVLENVKLAAMCEPSLQEKPKKRAMRVLAKVGLSHKLHHSPQTLSAGEQQRAGIARAIVNEPFLLLADEPVSHLDSETSNEIIDTLAHLNRAGTAMLIATHQPERFSSLNPRIITMDRGKVISS
jgi:cell division transport system ATP-binding protein